MTSELDSGLEIARMAKGMALTTRFGMSSNAGATPIESSMYISTFPLLLGGIETDSSRVCLNGIGSGREKRWIQGCSN